MLSSVGVGRENPGGEIGRTDKPDKRDGTLSNFGGARFYSRRVADLPVWRDAERRNKFGRGALVRREITFRE